jgi:Ca2+-dependent lipid-binding protein
MIDINRYPGTIKIHVIEGKIEKNYDLVGKMDPYLQIVTSKNGKYRTYTAKEAGQCPKWDEMFEIPLSSREELLGFALFDEDWFKDELIATSKFSVIQLTESMEPEWFQFKDKANKVVAEMSLMCTWNPTRSSNFTKKFSPKANAISDQISQ